MRTDNIVRHDYATITHKIKRDTKPLRAAIRQRYAWPGGYELFAVADGGEALCMNCCRAHYWTIAHSIRHGYNDGWRVVGIGADCDLDNVAYCAHCSKTIGDDHADHAD